MNSWANLEIVLRTTSDRRLRELSSAGRSLRQAQISIWAGECIVRNCYSVTLPSEPEDGSRTEIAGWMKYFLTTR
jgi:hypothetical protein